MQAVDLNDVQVRILGSLMEKALSTPDYYPLSLNALTNACNQKSSRDPVYSLDETEVQDQAELLCRKGLVRQSNAGRVVKYEELFSQAHNFLPRETSVLSVLLLRGPQTIGEIRSRTTRLHAFESLGQVQETIAGLEEWGLLIKCLERRPGHKEVRYVQLLSAPVEPEASAAADPRLPDSALGHERMERLEQDVETLRLEIDALKKAFQIFREQFE